MGGSRARTLVVIVAAAALLAAVARPAVAAPACPGLFDRWSPKVTLRWQATTSAGAFNHYVAPIHAIVLAQPTAAGRARVLMMGYRKWPRATGETGAACVATKSTAFLDWEYAEPDHAVLNRAPAADTEVDVGLMARPGDYKKSGETAYCSGHAHTDDGKVWAVGGESDDGEGGLDYGQVFDPATSKWKRIAHDLKGTAHAGTRRRWYPTVTRTHDARLLVIGGWEDVSDTKSSLNRSVEIGDPRRLPGNPWTLLSPHAKSPREAVGLDYTFSFLLPEPITRGARRREIVTLGERIDGACSVSKPPVPADCLIGTVHLFNYSDRSVAAGKEDTRWHKVQRPLRPIRRSGVGRPTADSRTLEGSSALLLPFKDLGGGKVDRSKVLIAGGTSDPSVQERLDIYDVARDVWEPAASSAELKTGVSRHHPGALLLPDGNVLIVGGHSHAKGTSVGDPRSVQLFEPTARSVCNGASWAKVGATVDAAPRGYHSIAVVLPSGAVLIGGGQTHLCVNTDYDGDERTDLRFYYPWYWSKTRPLVAAPKGGSWPTIRYGDDIAIDFARQRIDRVVLMALPSFTHSYDLNQRSIELRIKAGSNTYDGRNGHLIAHAPTNAYIAPPGYYMLHVVHDRQRADRTVHWSQRWLPSAAAIVRIAPDATAPTTDGGPSARDAGGALRDGGRIPSGDGGPPSDPGCSCRTSAGAPTPITLAVALLVLTGARRRRGLRP